MCAPSNLWRVSKAVACYTYIHYLLLAVLCVQCVYILFSLSGGGSYECNVWLMKGASSNLRLILLALPRPPWPPWPPPEPCGEPPLAPPWGLLSQ